MEGGAVVARVVVLHLVEGRSKTKSERILGFDLMQREEEERCTVES